MDTPTYYQNIKPLFSQYDRIKMMYFADLWDYQQVKAHAKTILLSLKPRIVDGKPDPAGWSELPEVHVMPLYTGPWPKSQVAIFESWIAAGCPEGEAPPAPPTPGPLVEGFLTLSRVLTGFDDLNDKVLAQTYINRLLAESNAAKNNQLEALLTAFSHNPQVLDADGNCVSSYSQYLALIQDITVLWYLSSIDGALGTPENNQYIQGLVWPAIDAHPMGFANTNEQFYWRYKPEGGDFTGLQIVVPRAAKK